MENKRTYIVGGYNSDGNFRCSETCHEMKSAIFYLKEAVKNRSILSPIQYKIYEVCPQEVKEDNPEINFFDEAQKIIDALDIQGNIAFETRWKDDRTAIYRHISIYANRCFALNDKTNTLIYRVKLQHYGDLKYYDKWEELEQELYDSLYCVEIPKMKKVLRDMNSNIRISIVDDNRRKLIPGFITK